MNMTQSKLLASLLVNLFFLFYCLPMFFPYLRPSSPLLTTPPSLLSHAHLQDENTLLTIQLSEKSAALYSLQVALKMLRDKLGRQQCEIDTRRNERIEINKKMIQMNVCICIFLYMGHSTSSMYIY